MELVGRYCVLCISCYYHFVDHAEKVEVVDEMSTETEEMDIVLEKREGGSLGFTVCRGNGDVDG